jgi:hypothetical protein
VGQRGHGKSRALYFIMEKETKIIHLEHDILYTTENYRHLIEKILLVIGYHIEF